MDRNRITREYIQDRIEDVSYLILPLDRRCTVCQITLDNGFTVRGESICVDPDNFEEKVGRKVAYDNAFQQLWKLFGFMLTEDLYREALSQ